jgi:hypothetical protein
MPHQSLVAGRVRGRPRFNSEGARKRVFELQTECHEQIAEDPNVHTFCRAADAGAVKDCQEFNCKDCQFYLKNGAFLEEPVNTERSIQTTYICVQCSFSWRNGLYYVCKHCRKPYDVEDPSNSAIVNDHTTVFYKDEPKVELALKL